LANQRLGNHGKPTVYDLYASEADRAPPENTPTRAGSILTLTFVTLTKKAKNIIPDINYPT
jgi:hypothetical protein